MTRSTRIQQHLLLTKAPFIREEEEEEEEEEAGAGAEGSSPCCAARVNEGFGRLLLL